MLHELRRYVRIPVITEVSLAISGDSRRLTATSIEVSSGGMSMRSAEDLTAGQSVEISFALLTLPRVWVRGSVSWRNEAGRAFGIRFDPQDERRLRIKEWIDSCVEGNIFVISRHTFSKLSLNSTDPDRGTHIRNINNLQSS